eukprot:896694-Rhodomonas_salina.7
MLHYVPFGGDHEHSKSRRYWPSVSWYWPSVWRYWPSVSWYWPSVSWYWVGTGLAYADTAYVRAVRYPLLSKRMVLPAWTST